MTTVDDSGNICIFGRDKILKMTLKGIHEESVPTLTFSKDSMLMLTACTLGNVRIFSCYDFDGNLTQSFEIKHLIIMEFRRRSSRT